MQVHRCINAAQVRVRDHSRTGRLNTHTHTHRLKGNLRAGESLDKTFLLSLSAFSLWDRSLLDTQTFLSFLCYSLCTKKKKFKKRKDTQPFLTPDWSPLISLWRWLKDCCQCSWPWWSWLPPWGSLRKVLTRLRSRRRNESLRLSPEVSVDKHFVIMHCSEYSASTMGVFLYSYLLHSFSLDSFSEARITWAQIMKKLCVSLWLRCFSFSGWGDQLIWAQTYEEALFLARSQ